LPLDESLPRIDWRLAFATHWSAFTGWPSLHIGRPLLVGLHYRLENIMTPINALHRRHLIADPTATGRELEHRLAALGRGLHHLNQYQHWLLLGERRLAATHYQAAFNIMVQQRAIDSYLTLSVQPSLPLAA